MFGPLATDDGHFSKTWGGGRPACQEAWGGFTVSGSKFRSSKHADPPANWECCMGTVAWSCGSFCFDLFFKQNFPDCGPERFPHPWCGSLQAVDAPSWFWRAGCIISWIELCFSGQIEMNVRSKLINFSAFPILSNSFEIFSCDLGITVMNHPKIL